MPGSDADVDRRCEPAATAPSTPGLRSENDDGAAGRASVRGYKILGLLDVDGQACYPACAYRVYIHRAGRQRHHNVHERTKDEMVAGARSRGVDLDIPSGIDVDLHKDVERLGRGYCQPPKREHGFRKVGGT